MIPTDPPSATRTQSFEERLKAPDLPPPGPSYYAARRALWLTPTDHIREPATPSSSRRKLEKLLSTPDTVTNDQVWKGGVEKVWKGLSSGVSLKKKLPMELVVKILHCAWVQDGTWPAGAIAPESDDVLLEAPTTDWLAGNGTNTTQSRGGDSRTMLSRPAQVCGYVLPRHSTSHDYYAHIRCLGHQRFGSPQLQKGHEKRAGFFMYAQRISPRQLLQPSDVRINSTVEIMSTGACPASGLENDNVLLSLDASWT
ncbi:hypothetical protein L218DRAFT_599418 [Marasmius fiardii PR-910]|nr:hypothetical protein L218DRAFT_599418 [Marasmius fiardii PR-910]